LFLFYSCIVSPSTIGKATKVIALNALVAIPQIPLPNMTAPMYLNGKPAAMENTDPCAVPENAPKISSKTKTA